MPQIYSFNDYLITKYNNSILQRFENLCNTLTTMLSMPVVIAGLHTKFKNIVSGKERDIKDITPRCVLTYGGISMDRGACTSIQATAPINAVDETGEYKEVPLQYRRLPLNADFNVAIVMNDAANAIRMTEYLAMLSFIFPHTPGDEHTVNTCIFSEQWNIDNDQERNNYNVTGSLQVNMQVIEPMQMSTNDEQYPLFGVGIQRPDGTWDETPWGEPVIDPETGEPVIDPETGEPLVGAYIEHGWVRLWHRFHVHGHQAWDECLEEAEPNEFERPAGAYVLGYIDKPNLPKWDYPTSTIVGSDAWKDAHDNDQGY